MEITAAHTELYENVRRFCIAEINPHVNEWEKPASGPPASCAKRWASLVT